MSAPGPAAAAVAHPGNRYRWLRHGGEAFSAFLELIGQAREQLHLETFIYHPDDTGNAVRTALLAAQRRGVQVRVMCDALGSHALPRHYWDELRQAGGEFRWFNPLAFNRLAYRDHRKILTIDGHRAIIGGFNIGDEYTGDGVEQGWRDLGLEIEGPLAGELAESFEEMFARAEFRHGRFQRWRRTRSEEVIQDADWTLLLTGPGRRHRAIKQSLAKDFGRARAIRIVSAYFLPNLRLLRELKRAARRGAKVQLILAGKSDVRLMRLATRGLYLPLLRAGVEINEYHAQVLHAKMVVVDDVVYAGSANLDARSLSINYELLVRVESARLAEEARELFAADLAHCQPVTLAEHRRGWSRWQGFLQRWAYFILARLDPYLARRQRRNVAQS